MDATTNNQERIERLICRRLDGEITPAEKAELDQILTNDPAARELFDAYQQNDFLAAEALRIDFDNASAVAVRNPNRGFWVAAAGAVLTAAAMVALSFLYYSNPSTNRDRVTQHSTQPQSPEAGHFADYRNFDHQPKQRWDNIYRDLIGIRGDNPNVIYIFERESFSTEVVPISSEF